MRTDRAGADLPLNNAAREGGRERLPLLEAHRTWRSPWAYLWAVFAYGAATWAFLTGGLLATYADAPRAMAAFFAGHTIALMVVILGIVIPCAKYGIDMIDLSKTQFGTRGAMLVLVVLVTILLGWGAVIVVLAGQAIVSIWQQYVTESGADVVRIVAGGVLLVTIWMAASRGAQAFKQVSMLVGPGLLVLAVFMFVALLIKAGPGIFTKQPAPMDEPLSKPFTFALLTEWGLGYGLSWWTAQSFARLSGGPRSAWWLTFIGWGVLQVGIVFIALFSGLYTGQSDPTQWMVPILGLAGGLVALVFIVVANWTSTVGIIYIAGVALQQIPAVQRTPWRLTCGLLTLPAVYVVIFPDWFMENFPIFLAYNAILIAPVCTIQAVDYFLLRRQRLDVRAILADAPGGQYWYWAGFNWVAIAICAICFVAYLLVFDPISLDHVKAFEFVTATLPVMGLSAVLYYAAMRVLIRVAPTLGGYERAAAGGDRAAVPAGAHTTSV